MYQKEQIIIVTKKMAYAVLQKKDYLGELDGKSGDGDLGISMAAAYTACAESVQASLETDLGKLLMQAGMACNKAAPSTMGTLLSCGIMALGKASRGKTELTDADICAFPRIFADAIAQRGKSRRGDKTILDALYPMAETVEGKMAAGASLKEAFVAGASAASQAANATAGMVAKSGRAKWIGERAAEYPDGGAVMCAIAMRGALAE